MAAKIISDVMAKCRKKLHDTVPAIGINFPDYDELVDDLSVSETYFNALKNEEKKV